MHRRSVRHGLVVLLLATGASAAVYAWSADRQLRESAIAEHAAAARFDSLGQAIARFDTAQQTFDAGRESEEAWFVRVQRLLGQVQSEGARLRQAASPDAASAARTFADVTARVASAVARGEENLRAGRDLMATDLVQDEGRPGADGMRAAIVEWRGAEIAAADSARATLLQQLWWVLGGTASVWVLGVLLLAARAPAPEKSTLEQLASLLKEPAKEPAGDAALSMTAPAAPPAMAPDVAPPPPAPAPPPVDLAPAAALCADIGRADTPDALTVLLGRTATIIDAAGLVIWLKGPTDALLPVATHGYGPHALALLGPLPLDATNATTSAWHSGRLQAVAGDEHTRGALAVPMFQGSRCTGVFAAELRGGREREPMTRALTSILAAQFAATVAPEAASEAAETSAADSVAESPLELPLGSESSTAEPAIPQEKAGPANLEATGS